MSAFKNRIAEARNSGRKLILAGNGASASIASHLATDFSKQGKVRAMAFNDANLITALGNDCGYENWIAKALDFYADKDDVLILISSSGKSPNVVKAAQRGKELGLYVAAFTGFAKSNPLGAVSDINFWVDSRSYNIIECTHMIWLTAVVDLLIGASEYSVAG
jgi:D-sedoheptulose 7-phosphate isomerase